MAKKYDALTKSKITSGLQCHKKLWFDVHQPIREDKAAFKRGFRFEDEVRKIYAKGQKVLDLSPEKVKLQEDCSAIKNFGLIFINR